MKDQDKVKILQDLIRIESVNNYERQVALYLEELFKSYNIRTELVDYDEDRSSLVAYYGKGQGKILGLSGHMDVVSAGFRDNWTHPPFEGKIVDGIMYGRGTSDMKSGLAACAIAICEFAEANPEFEGQLKLLATVGEEVGQLGAEQLTRLGYADDLDALLIAEPTGNLIAYAHKGNINYRVKSFGKSAHSSMPDEGINAIDNINSFISLANSRMDQISKDYLNDTLGRTIHNITIIKGGSQVNSIPDYVELEANIRLIPEYTNDRVVQDLKNIIADLNAKQDGRLDLIIDYNKVPVYSDKDSDLIKAILKSTDRKLKVSGISPTTDAAEFSRADKDFDIAIFGPGVETSPHKDNEHVYLDDYLEFIEIYKSMIKNYFKL